MPPQISWARPLQPVHPQIASCVLCLSDLALIPMATSRKVSLQFAGGTPARVLNRCLGGR